MNSLTNSSRQVLVAGLVVIALAGGLAAQSESYKVQQPSSAHEAATKLQPLNIKPGLWETTRTYTMVGEMPIPADMLAKLSPEQRARFEERMKAHSAANTKTVTDKKCLTKQDLEQADFGGSKGECTQTIISSTSNKATGTLSCDVEGVTVKGSIEIEALDQEHVKGLSHGTATGGGRARNVDTTFTSKWIGPSCGSKQ